MNENNEQPIVWRKLPNRHNSYQAEVGPVNVTLDLWNSQATFTHEAKTGEVAFSRTLSIPDERPAQRWAEKIARAMWMYPATPDLLAACIWAREFIVAAAAEDLEIVQVIDAAIKKAGGVEVEAVGA